jgi:Protein of unknown function (Hypoth_ymh)
MDSDKAISLLRDRLKELAALPPTYGTPEFRLWRHKMDLTLPRIFGDEHYLVEGFADIVFYGPVSSTTGERIIPEQARTEAQAILEAGIYELEELSEPVEFTQDAAIDPELWEHVRRLVEQEQWAQVASQTAIFVEDKVRQWAGRPDAETTTHLMTAVLKPAGGVFPLGRTDSEAEGWHQLGRGFMGAVRNVATHRIEQRDDAKRWALGVLGVGSLLLTQLRHQHANSFKS